MPTSKLPPNCSLARRRCRICGAILARDRSASAIACSCHPGGNEPYNPRHDKYLDKRVLGVLLYAESPDTCYLCGGRKAVSVTRRLGTEDHKAIWCAVRRLRQKGWVIDGIPGIGYRLR
jgi:hypothetical protein